MNKLLQLKRDKGSDRITCINLSRQNNAVLLKYLLWWKCIDLMWRKTILLSERSYVVGYTNYISPSSVFNVTQASISRESNMFYLYKETQYLRIKIYIFSGEHMVLERHREFLHMPISIHNRSTVTNKRTRNTLFQDLVGVTFRASWPDW